MSLVLDCSMTAAWLYPDEATQETRRVLTLVTDTGAVVPVIWHAEIANVLQMAVRKGRIEVGQRAMALDHLGKLGIETDPDTNRHVWGAAIALADRHELTVYDATYLELAVRRRLPLATLDKELRDAAMAESVALLGL
jgi:predicted nucleic acid-binding protein